MNDTKRLTHRQTNRKTDRQTDRHTQLYSIVLKEMVAVSQSPMTGVSDVLSGRSAPEGKKRGRWE